jgi:hypothetical protein
VVVEWLSEFDVVDRLATVALVRQTAQAATTTWEVWDSLQPLLDILYSLTHTLHSFVVLSKSC